MNRFCQDVKKGPHWGMLRRSRLRSLTAINSSKKPVDDSSSIPKYRQFIVEDFKKNQNAPIRPSETVSYEEIFPGNFGVGEVKKILGKKKRFLRGNFSEKFPRPKFPQEKKDSNTPSRGNF